MNINIDGKGWTNKTCVLSTWQQGSGDEVWEEGDRGREKSQDNFLTFDSLAISSSRPTSSLAVVVGNPLLMLSVRSISCVTSPNLAANGVLFTSVRRSQVGCDCQKNDFWLGPQWDRTRPLTLSDGNDLHNDRGKKIVCLYDLLGRCLWRNRGCPISCQ